MRILVTVLFSMFIIYAPSSISGGVYKCTDRDGRVTFQSIECHTSSEEVVIQEKQKISSEIVKVKTDLKIDDEQKNKCLNFYDDMLKDPRSAYIVSADVYHMTNTERKLEWDIVILDTRSKNGMGGYGILTLACKLDSELKINEEGSVGYKAMLGLGITP
ncbi:MAG: DUF4124 domain-containing protein [Plesiomonas sp.]